MTCPPVLATPDTIEHDANRATAGGNDGLNRGPETGGRCLARLDDNDDSIDVAHRSEGIASRKQSMRVEDRQFPVLGEVAQQFTDRMRRQEFGRGGRSPSGRDDFETSTHRMDQHTRCLVRLDCNQPRLSRELKDHVLRRLTNIAVDQDHVAPSDSRSDCQPGRDGRRPLPDRGGDHLDHPKTLVAADSLEREGQRLERVITAIGPGGDDLTVMDGAEARDLPQYRQTSETFDVDAGANGIVA